eukprot:749366-Pyramimonas_sp.AAC.1
MYIRQDRCVERPTFGFGRLVSPSSGSGGASKDPAHVDDTSPDSWTAHLRQLSCAAVVASLTGA